MPSYLSTKNRTEVPLPASGFFLGGIDYSLNYTNCDVSLLADTDCRIRIYGSNEQVNWSLIFDETVSASDHFFQTLLLYHPFIKSTVENLDASPQTQLIYQLIYREHAHAFHLSSASLSTALEIIDKQRVSSAVFISAPVLANGVSAVVALNASKFTTISVYGNVSGPCDLTLQFSRDNVNWFNSQYTFSITSLTGADFGASLPCSASYLRLKRTDTAIPPITASAVIEST